MSRKAILKQKIHIESLICANMAEANYVRKLDNVDWAILDSYYSSGRALAAQHLEIMHQLAPK
ncbi:hypothetical protein [Spirosoma litoris]